MSVSETVFNALHKEKDLLGTQDRLAKKLGKSQGIIQKYLSGIEHVQGMKLETLDFLFPNAIIDLKGDGNVVSSSDDRRILELERKNLELDKENLELKKRIFELERKEIESLKTPAPASSSSELSKVLQKG